MKVLLVSDLIIPTFNIGIIRPFLELKKEGTVTLRMDKPASISSKDMDWCDVAIFCRNQDITSFNVFKELKARRKFVIYDIDDNFFELPLDSALSYYHRKSEHIYTLEFFLKYSDVVTVYSTTLQKKALEYSNNVRLLKCYFDSSIIEGCTHEKKSKLRIAYATGRSSDSDMEKPLEEALEEVLFKYGNDVEVHFWRAPFKAIENHKSVVQHSATPNYESFMRNFYELGIDIGLAPLADGVFYNSKTNNKYREYSGCSIAGVYSNVELYQSCISNYENGILVDNNKNDWFSAIESLIQSPELRGKLSQNASLDVAENYSFQNSISQWRNIILELHGVKPQSLSNDIINKNKRLLWLHVKANSTELSNSTYQLLQNIHRNHQLLIPDIYHKGRKDELLARYYGRVVCWYVCNGDSDQDSIRELSKKFEYIIVDLNGLDIEDYDVDNAYYLYQSDSNKEVVINEKSVTLPSRLSTIGRGKDTSEYVVFYFTEKLNIGKSSRITECLDKFSLEVKWLVILEKYGNFLSNIKSKYFNNFILKVKSVFLYNYIKYKIRF